MMMTNECETCKYALFDYEEYYGTTAKEWFVCGCEKGNDPDECEEYEYEE